VEIDSRGKIRFQIENLQAPCDAHAYGSDRVVIAEQNAARVSERDYKGNIIWQKPINQPMGVEHLSNGHTFIVGRNQLVEVDKGGKEVYSYNRPAGDIMAAQKLRNRQVAFITNQGVYTRMDGNSKELKTVHLSPIQWWGTGGFEILKNDHVLMCHYNNQKVVEYDGDGKVVWEAAFQWPTTAHRLPNGNTVIGSQQSAKLVEVDKTGKVVKEYKEQYRANRIRSR